MVIPVENQACGNWVILALEAQWVFWTVSFNLVEEGKGHMVGAGTRPHFLPDNQGGSGWAGWPWLLLGSCGKWMACGWQARAGQASVQPRGHPQITATWCLPSLYPSSSYLLCFHIVKILTSG